MRVLLSKTIDVIRSINGSEEIYRDFMVRASKEVGIALDDMHTDYINTDFDPFWNHYIEIAAPNRGIQRTAKELMSTSVQLYQGDMGDYVTNIFSHVTSNIIKSYEFDDSFIIDLSAAEWKQLLLATQLMK